VNILYVEDNEAVRSIGLEFIDELGYSVVGCETAEAALEELAKGTQFQVLLTDVSLPGMSGTDLARIVAKDHPTMRLIMASGYGWQRDLDSIGPRVMSLPKPFDLDELESMLGKIDEETKG
jgi:DNA-binding NtrC family response regulator